MTVGAPDEKVAASPNGLLILRGGIVAAVVAGAAVTIAPLPPTALFAVATAYLVGAGGWLAVVDARTHRLPDWILLPSTGVFAVLALLAWADTGDASVLLRCVVACAATWGIYAVMERFGSLGHGDVKLGAALAIVLGWGGWDVALAGPVIGFVCAAVVAIVLLATGRGRSTHIAFGPYLIAGAVLACAGRILA